MSRPLPSGLIDAQADCYRPQKCMASRTAIAKYSPRLGVLSSPAEMTPVTDVFPLRDPRRLTKKLTRAAPMTLRMQQQAHRGVE